jgi:hypothetical protein
MESNLAIMGANKPAEDTWPEGTADQEETWPEGTAEETWPEGTAEETWLEDQEHGLIKQEGKNTKQQKEEKKAKADCCWYCC